MQVTVYSRDNCPNCDKALAVLRQYKPSILKIGKDISRDDFFKKFPNVKTVPQIIIDNTKVGGFSDLKLWLEKRELDDNF